MDFTFSKEQLSTQQTIRDFCQNEIAPGAADLDRAAPEEAMAMIRERILKLAESGLLGLGFSSDAGGVGTDLIGPVFLMQELGAVCPSTGLAVLSSVGLCARALHEWGAQAEKDRDLAALLRGQAVGAFGSLEPEAGLDDWTFRAEARKAGDGFSLTGRKSMVLNAPMNGVKIFTAAEGEAAGLFLVAPDAAGMEISPPQVKMGCRGVPTGDVTLEDCPAVKLQAEGAEDPVARLRFHEHLLLGALAEGMISGAMRTAGVYARDTLAGGKPLGRHQEISFKLADTRVFQETARMLIYRAVWLQEQNDPEAPVLASSAKAFASESAVKAADHAMQITGNQGFQAGSQAERIFRDAKLLEILGDPTEKHRMFIADSVLQGD